MSNGTPESQGPTPPTDSPPEVDPVQEAKEKAEKLAKEWTDLVMQQQGPPGTPGLHKP